MKRTSNYLVVLVYRYSCIPTDLNLTRILLASGRRSGYFPFMKIFLRKTQSDREFPEMIPVGSKKHYLQYKYNFTKYLFHLKENSQE